MMQDTSKVLSRGTAEVSISSHITDSFGIPAPLPLTGAVANIAIILVKYPFMIVCCKVVVGDMAAVPCSNLSGLVHLTSKYARETTTNKPSADTCQSCISLTQELLYNVITLQYAEIAHLPGATWHLHEMIVYVGMAMTISHPWKIQKTTFSVSAIIAVLLHYKIYIRKCSSSFGGRIGLSKHTIS